MDERPISEVETDLDGAIQRDIEELGETYRHLETAAETVGELGSLDTYFDINIETIIERLKRARQWERKLESHQQGLLNHSQVMEQIDDDAPGIEARINQADRYVASFLDTLEEVQAAAEDDAFTSQAATVRNDLRDQRQELDDLTETLNGVDTDLQDAGFLWIE